MRLRTEIKRPPANKVSGIRVYPFLALSSCNRKRIRYEPGQRLIAFCEQPSGLAFFPIIDFAIDDEKDFSCTIFCITAIESYSLLESGMMSPSTAAVVTTQFLHVVPI